MANIFKKYPKVTHALWQKQYMNPAVRYIVHKLGFHRNVSQEFIQNYIKTLGELSPEVFFQLLNEMKTQGITTRLESIKVPTLIIAGERDYIVPNYVQDILKNKLPNGQLYTLKEGLSCTSSRFSRFSKRAD